MPLEGRKIRITRGDSLRCIIRTRYAGSIYSPIPNMGKIADAVMNNGGSASISVDRRSDVPVPTGDIASGLCIQKRVAAAFSGPLFDMVDCRCDGVDYNIHEVRNSILREI